MAFKNGLGDRFDELRFPALRSPPDETPYSGYISPPRGQPSYMSALRQPVNDARASLQRRFTEGSGKMTTLTPIGQPVSDAIDLSTLVCTISSQLSSRLEFHFHRGSSSLHR